jgi:hypothetical protein
MKHFFNLNVLKKNYFNFTLRKNPKLTFNTMKKVYLSALCLLVNQFIFGQAVGIGDVVFTPNYLLHVHQNAASGVVAQFTNSTTGNTSTDGFLINLNGSNVELINREDAGMRFYTNNIERARITNTGNVGIGTATPDASARLDVASTNQGFLPPRVALTAKNAAAPITTPATGLMVYNTATAGTAPNNVSPGYYYWDGSNWQRFIDGPRFISVESTSGVTANATWQAIPGTTLTGTWAAGDILFLNYSGVFVNQSTGFAYASVDVAPFVSTDGGVTWTMLAIGGYTRGELTFNYSPTFMPYASLAVYTIPTTGTYLFRLQTIRTSGTANVLVGGNSSQVSECIFTIQTIKP